MRGRRLEKTGRVFAEYVEDFYGPRTTQMAADHSSQQNGIIRTDSCGRMLKKSVSFVLASLRGSPYH